MLAFSSCDSTTTVSYCVATFLTLVKFEETTEILRTRSFIVYHPVIEIIAF